MPAAARRHRDLVVVGASAAGDGTGYFRDAEAWTLIKSSVIPRLLDG
jgi:hypothetical protein